MFDKDGHKIGDSHRLTPQVGNRDKKFYDDFDKFDYPQKQIYNYHSGKNQQGNSQQPQYQQKRTRQRAETPPEYAEKLRIYVTLKSSTDTTVDYKKIILMISPKVKISILKRTIEKEFADLYPKEPPFITSKVEDEYGYSLSNSSRVGDLLKFGSRVYAIPENLYGKKMEGEDLPISGDIYDLLHLLKNIQQSISAKIADYKLKDFEQKETVLQMLLPLGFSQNPKVNHNVSVILNKLFANENLEIFEMKENTTIFNLLLIMLHYWITKVIQNDNFLLNALTELLEILTKSAYFCRNFDKSPNKQVMSRLMMATKFDFISSQTRSRLIKVISYLSKGKYSNTYASRESKNRPYDYQRKQSQQSQLDRVNDAYVPSFASANKPRSRRQGRPPILKNKPSVTPYHPVNKVDHYNDSQLSAKTNQFGQYGRTEKDNNGMYNPMPHRITPEDTSMKMMDFGGGKPDHNLFGDYISLLNPENTADMHSFAIQNLDSIIDSAINAILQSKSSYLGLLNVIELDLPPQLQDKQKHIMQAISYNLNMERAIDGLQKGIVMRLVKGFKRKKPSFHKYFIDLINAHLKQGRYQADLTTLISLVQSPYQELQLQGVKAMSIVSDPNFPQADKYVIQFENHIKGLIEITLARNKTAQFKNYSLQTIANLCIRENLKPALVYNKCIDVLCYHLKNQDNVDGMRIAAKALLNLSIHDRNVKLKVIASLGDDLNKIHKNEYDAEVQSYLQLILNSQKSF